MKDRLGFSFLYFAPRITRAHEPWFGRLRAHGYACAEIVHDIAPDAELHLVRVNGPTTFENGIAWAIAHDIDIISVSMSFFNNAYYDGSGRVATLVEALQQCRSPEATLVLSGLQPRVRSVFEIAKLDAVFTIRDDVDAALED